MQITFLLDPDYTVHFDQFLPKVEAKSVVQRTITLAQSCLCELAATIKQAAWLTLNSAKSIFKEIFFNYRGSLWNLRFPCNAEILAWNIAVYVLEMVWVFAKAASPFSLLPARLDLLQQFADPAFNLSHLRAYQTTIDTSHVPASVKVDDLLTIFDAIDFDDSGALGHVSPDSLKEEQTFYTVEKLRERLSLFVNRVNGRMPFLYTPPATDPVRLEAFYKQIEDALRVSIHKVVQDLADFQKAYGSDISKYEEKNVLEQYRSLLEERAMLAIDLAIAGGHCGTRYMGETMSCYHRIMGNGAFDSSSMNFEELLVDFLASLRKDVAYRHIQNYFKDSDGAVNAHAYNRYLACLGKVLGLPDSENIDEMFAEDFDYTRFLTLFFQEYTVDFIIDKLQEKLKTSQSFREKMFDWLKDQANDWNLSLYQDEKLINSISELESIIKELNEISAKVPLDILQGLTNNLRDKKIQLRAIKETWDRFLVELYASDESKAWLISQSEFKDIDPKDPAKNVKNRREKTQKYIEMCQENVLGSATTAILKASILEEKEIDTTPLIPKLANYAKIKKMIAALPLGYETYQRILEKKTDLRQAVQNYYEQQRKNDFLSAFKLTDILKIEDKWVSKIEHEGVSKELMEWICVSQNIFNVQTASVETIQPISNMREIPEFLIELIHKSKNQTLCPITNSKRYKFYDDTVADLIRVYKSPEAFKVIKTACIRYLDPSFDSFSSRIEKAITIQLPRTVAKILSNQIVQKVISGMITIAVAFISYIYLLDLISDFTRKKITPIFFNRLPDYLISICNRIILFQNAISNEVCYIACTMGRIRKNISIIPNSRTKEIAIKAERIFSMIIESQSVEFFLARKICQFYEFNKMQCDKISHYFNLLADKNEKTQINARLKKITVLAGGCCKTFIEPLPPARNMA